MKNISIIIITLMVTALGGLVLFLAGLEVEYENVPEETAGTMTIAVLEEESYFLGTNLSENRDLKIVIDVTSEETKRLMKPAGIGTALIDDRP